MARKRKSRDQKIKADSRHKEYHLSATYAERLTPTANSLESLNLNTISITKSVAIDDHLRKDLTRTGAITGFILAFQVISLLILHHHSISLFGTIISY